MLSRALGLTSSHLQDLGIVQLCILELVTVLPLSLRMEASVLPASEFCRGGTELTQKIHLYLSAELVPPSWGAGGASTGELGTWGS